MLNPELAEIARYTISEMRGEGWNDDEDIMWCTCGSVVLATWHIRSKKSDLHLSDHAFPEHKTRLRDKGNPVLLAE